jgi:predicted acyl esterase
MAETTAWISMADGTRLAATLFVPETTGPWPVILEALPYRKDDVTYYHTPEYRRLRDEGEFVVARVDLRGTGSSEGIALDEYLQQEQDDLCEVIAWLADQEWCNGSVGMYGVSYGGFNSIQVAMERPPALKAIVPIFATDDRYTDDVHYYGGARKQLDVIDYPLYMVCMNALPPVPSLAGEGWRDLWAERLESLEPWLLRWTAEQDDGPYWRHGSLRPHYDRIACATMIVAGWADGYRNASFRMFERLEAPKRLLFGPWSHASTETSRPGPRIDLVPELIRWFNRWLREDPNGIDEEPPIVVFARRSTRPAPDLDSYNGTWRFEPEWPPARLKGERLSLADADVAPLSHRLDVRPDVGATAWISCAGGLPWGQPDDQRPDEAFSLVYDWGPLEQELEILGYPRLEVTITSSSPVAFLSAKLCDVWPDGTSALVARGFLNLTHRESHEAPSALATGRSYRVTVEFDATSWTWETGHRIRLDVAGSDWPNAWSPPELGELTIAPSDSGLELPVLRGDAVVAEPPRPSPPSSGAAENGASPQVVWRLERDVVERVTRAVVDHGGVSDLGNGTRLDERYGGTVGVSTSEPGVAWAEGRSSFEVTWPEVTARAEARGRLRSDSGSYDLHLELDVWADGEIVASRVWDQSHPRRLQ